MDLHGSMLLIWLFHLIVFQEDRSISVIHIWWHLMFLLLSVKKRLYNRLSLPHQCILLHCLPDIPIFLMDKNIRYISMQTLKEDFTWCCLCWVVFFFTKASVSQCEEKTHLTLQVTSYVSSKNQADSVNNQNGAIVYCAIFGQLQSNKNMFFQLVSIT